MSKPGRRRSTRPNNRSSSAPQVPVSVHGNGRRTVLRRVRNIALMLAGVSGGSWYVGSEVLAGIEEADLSKIGNGIAAVVQIHDPQCPTCRALQLQVRKALTQFNDNELQYLVANIRQEKGRQLAARYRVEHVTLLLMDGQGNRVQTLTGLNSSETLVRAFCTHIATEPRH